MTAVPLAPPAARPPGIVDDMARAGCRSPSISTRPGARPDGGELRLYLGTGSRGRSFDVLPRGGMLVVFLSDRFPHEVLPARRERLSLAGWFRRRSLGG